MGHIYVFGSINIDLIATGAHLPQPGETIHGDNFEQAAGGKGANQALAACRAGAKTIMCGAVGHDNFAEAALASLREADVDLSHVKTVDGPTGIAVILVGRSGDNVISIIAGANGTLSPKDAEQALQHIGKNDILICQLEVPHEAVIAAQTIAHKNGATTIINTAPAVNDMSALAKNADIIIANETEFDILSGAKNDDLSRRQAVQSYAKAQEKLVIVTLGEKGAIAASADDLMSVPSLKVDAINAVGAGDTFCGYFAAALLKKTPIKRALKLAAHAGALACTRAGAQPSVPKLAEVEQTM